MSHNTLYYCFRDFAYLPIPTTVVALVFKAEIPEKLLLQERNVYNDSQLKHWCRDGDLDTFVTGEFDVITNMGGPINSQLILFCCLQKYFQEIPHRFWTLFN